MQARSYIMGHGPRGGQNLHVVSKLLNTVIYFTYDGIVGIIHFWPLPVENPAYAPANMNINNYKIQIYPQL